MLENSLRILKHKGVTGFVIALYYLAKANIYRRLLGQRYLKKKIFNYWMWLDTLDRGIGRTLILFGQREEDHRIILQKVLKPGMTVLDIGANIGYYAMMERELVGETGRIIAVEPAQGNIATLKRNVALNGYQNIDFFHMAISDTDGTGNLIISPFSNLHSFHSRTDRPLQTENTEEVETRTVPSMMAEFGKIDLIRMDVEGHEVEVFNGTLDSVEKGEISPMVVFETHLRQYTPDHDMMTPLRRLFASGYKARFVASSSDWGTKQVEALGYRGGPLIPTDFEFRKLFENVSDDDVIHLLCKNGGVRTVLLAKDADSTKTTEQNSAKKSVAG
ncbi:MAG: FkbM family methyltransferase [Rhodospirillaceae bacterium]|nr:FkbM family methyltransferase [Rhodospirillaceae bacterium]